MRDRLEFITGSMRLALRRLGNEQAIANARRESDTKRWEFQQVQALELRVPPPTTGERKGEPANERKIA